MSGQRLQKAVFATTAAAAAAAGQAATAGGPEIDIWIAKIKEGDDEERGDAWQGAWRYGAPAVRPLAGLMTDDNFMVARAAKRGLWKIVHHAGRPGADRERKAVVAQLLPALAESKDIEVRRELMWMLSEIAGDEAVEPVAGFLKDEKLLEDARMVLQRLPGEKSLAALKVGLKAVPEEFRINIAQSLRARGVEVPGLPCQKMVPTRKTDVKPIEQ